MTFDVGAPLKTNQQTNKLRYLLQRDEIIVEWFVWLLVAAIKIACIEDHIAFAVRIFFRCFDDVCEICSVFDVLL